VCAGSTYRCTWYDLISQFQTVSKFTWATHSEPMSTLHNESRGRESIEMRNLESKMLKHIQGKKVQEPISNMGTRLYTNF
jgi:hypothetical protein